MKLVLSLSVLAVARLMVLEGPAPAQADSGKTEGPNTLRSTVEETFWKAIDNIKTSDIWDWFSETFNKAKKTIKNTFS